MRKVFLALAGMFCILLAYGTTWDVTRYVHDPATGLLLKKIYADGHEINYTYTNNGYPKRITYATCAYEPFGEPAATAGPMADRFSFRFMTKRWDPFLGLYDFGERWYSMALRRWINRDPLGEDGGINLYAFCKPSQLKGYEYDVGRPIGATDGRVTSRIKIQIDSNGYIHAHPWP